MNKEQREELKRLAAEATPGPWIAAGPSFGGPIPVYCNEVCVDREGDDDDTYSVFGAPIGMDKEASSDMEYIAAANPKAITALLSALEAAEAAMESQKSEWLSWDAKRTALKRDAARYRFIRDVPYTDYVYNVMTHQKNGVMDSAIDKAMEAKCAKQQTNTGRQ